MIKNRLFENFSEPFDINLDFREQINRKRNKIFNVLNKSILTQESDLKTQSGKFKIEIDGVYYSGIFIKGSNKSLHVTYTGSRNDSHDSLNYPIVRRWSYAGMYDGCFLGIEDPMYHYHKNLKLGWFWGEENKSYLRGTFEIIKLVLQLNNINEKDIIFFSSSGGGYASLLASIWYPHTLSISINPQVVLKNWPQAKEFEKITNLSLDNDKLFRNNIVEDLSQSESKHLIIFNIESKHDIIYHLTPILKKYNISIRYGLTRFKNILFWLYQAKGLPSPHNSQETKYFYWLINNIAMQFKNDDNFDASSFQPAVLLLNEAWHDLYEFRRNLYDDKHKLQYYQAAAHNFFFNPNFTSESWTIDRVLEDINIIGVRNFSFFCIDKFEPNTAYNIILSGISAQNTDVFTHGIFDGPRNNIVNYTTSSVSDTVNYTFITGSSDINHLQYKIYSGPCGKTLGKNLFIKRLEIYKTKNITLSND